MCKIEILRDDDSGLDGEKAEEAPVKGLGFVVGLKCVELLEHVSLKVGEPSVWPPGFMLV